MKKIMSFFLVLAMTIGILIFPESGKVSAADNEKMHGAWVSTVFNIDWPSKASYGNAEKQKKEFCNLIDRLKGAGINTIILQVRPESDAFYKSKISPWSRYLTGTQGKDPGYDPLEYAIEQCHARGLKIHAWFNPYRACIYKDKSSTVASNPINKHPDWVINYNNKWYYDPGIPAVTDYIADVVKEVVENYDVDGVQFDDYFYPGSGFPDSATYKKYGNGANIDNWRRANINNMVRKVYQTVKSTKPDVDFGISPAGIWRNKYNDPNGSNTSGGESYIKQYADTRYWIKNGIVDYVCPQVYWRIGHPKADYETLLRWWSDQVKGTKVKLYIGEGIYKHGQSEYAGENVAVQVKDQLRLNRKYPEIKGEIFFSAKDILNMPQVYNDIKDFYKSENSGNSTSGNNNSDRRYPYQNSLIGADRAETAVKVSQKGWLDGADTVIFVNGKDYISGVVASPLAARYNAPILVSYMDNATESTISEIRRLKASKIIVVGKKDSVLEKCLANIKKNIPQIEEKWIGGSNAQETSIEIAKDLSSDKKPEKIYVASETALADVLSVASKASNEKAPIIITGKDSISEGSVNWIKDANPSEIYFIGGKNTISDGVIDKISKDTGKDLSKNRIWGEDRIATNARVIEEFYKNSFFKKAFITKSSAPIDAITVSAFAQKSDSPVILAGKQISPEQTRVLSPRSASLVYEVGGGINQGTYKSIYNLLEGVMK